jgi:hypothetical protein
MDCTGSMSSWIKEAKDILISLIDKIKSIYLGFSFRVAFVGYRDFCDGS